MPLCPRMSKERGCACGLQVLQHQGSLDGNLTEFSSFQDSVKITVRLFFFFFLIN